jgi:tetratricopeptide (TPR) repeat protein
VPLLKEIPMANPVDLTTAIRAAMLRMGQTWYQLGKLSQAEDAYLRIVREHPGTAEAESAQRDLLAIAAGFEAEGRYHLAIDILDRLGKAAVTNE